MDIEDTFDTARVSNEKADAMVKVKYRQKANNEEELFHGDSFVPGTRTVYVRTWGCAHNTSDSEYMSGLLSMAGYNIVASKDSASMWILNSCTVKTPSEVQLDNNIKEAKKRNKLLVVAGCVSQAEPSGSTLRGVSLVGVKQIDRIVEVVDETFKGNCVRILSTKRTDQKLSMPKMRRNQLIEVLAINSGCLNHCTYCKTKQARGNLQSYSLTDLVDQATRAFAEGCRELWLTSEDLGAWGRDIGMVLPDLLTEIVKVIPEGCMMRLGMTNPPYILDFLQEIADILNHPRVYAFLHIPVQSGSDAVLQDMRREYCAADFCRVVDFMLQKVPNVYIATDMICAYPSETEEDFEESMELVKKYQFPSLFINQFYPRKGTPAARMKKINTVEARRRTAAMSRYFRSYSRYGEDRIGEEVTVLVAELATDQKHVVAHNKSYEHILLPAGDGSIMGKTVKVRITSVAKFHMMAELLPAEQGSRNEKQDLAGEAREKEDSNLRESESSVKTSELVQQWTATDSLLDSEREETTDDFGREETQRNGVETQRNDLDEDSEELFVVAVPKRYPELPSIWSEFRGVKLVMFVLALMIAMLLPYILLIKW